MNQKTGHAIMTQIILNDIDGAVVAKLAELARANQTSIEEQAQKLLVEALDSLDRRRQRLKIADRIAAMTPKKVVQTDSTILLREDRDR
jgi:antitoxin FitA